MGYYFEVDETNFDDEVLKSKLPVLVDFWAPWCGPCRMVAPIVEEIAKEYEGKIKVCKVNTDEAQNIAMKYQIASIPTLAIFKDGKEVKRQIGALPKPILKKFIDSNAF
ncbi:MAG: thioredoxin [Spirochaetota bacterium]